MINTARRYKKCKQIIKLKCSLYTGSNGESSHLIPLADRLAELECARFGFCPGCACTTTRPYKMLIIFHFSTIIFSVANDWLSISFSTALRSTESGAHKRKYSRAKLMQFAVTNASLMKLKRIHTYDGQKSQNQLHESFANILM